MTALLLAPVLAPVAASAPRSSGWRRLTATVTVLSASDGPRCGAVLALRVGSGEQVALGGHCCGSTRSRSRC